MSNTGIAILVLVVFALSIAALITGLVLLVLGIFGLGAIITMSGVIVLAMFGYFGKAT